MSLSHHILIYAELLSHLRQISIGCTLPTPASSATTSTVSASGRALTVTHDGFSETIKLPRIVAPFTQLPVRESGSTSLSWRLPLAATPTGRMPALSEESAPWSALDLKPGSEVVCRTCQSTIVDVGTLKVWKDLPSENWAEMMEFWHCHKPHSHTHDKDEEHLTTRGYGASSRITAQPGVGFVDLTSFLLAKSDLVTSLTSPSIDSTEASNQAQGIMTLHCGSCQTQLGVQNNDVSSVSIFKWQVVVQLQEQKMPESFPSLAQCVSAMLIATMARSGCSQSILLPSKHQSNGMLRSPESKDGNQGKDLLNIWVFNANFIFSSTEAPASPINAMKVFYRTVSQEEADKMIESMTLGVQDISLPSEAIAILVDLLQKSNYFVPVSDRRFKDWNVGLLEKWDNEGGWKP
ncbi:ubiquitin-conjugating enzyme E2-binding protein [Xylaria bambusicola]|uniref:ubiquitin-conjugating enzyme E2-binding protein n=1 Tax=Xylaria bambusicola TaxID=326684 RepID=UPI002007F587|nr:ubiquitin-conjugating enzyme E2-binding protein [Xylaria bambusicola]KAI0508593.1 ubiquitin-conjugating enzyme E2-binding protein [Xylaria bambusicola]